jgi:hypothetical protein
MARAARGDLHLSDQPLEPLLMFTGFRLIVPHNLKIEELEARPIALQVGKTEASRSSHTFVAVRIPDGQIPKNGEYLITAFSTPPVTHGVIQRNPLTLLGLQELYERVGLDLVPRLPQRIKDWHLDHAHKHLLKFKLILLIFQPRKRRDGDETPELIERLAFCFPMTLEEIGKQLNVIDTLGGGGAGILIGQTTVDADQLKQIPAVPMVVHETLSSKLAASQNQCDDCIPSIVAVGAGSLGSQVVLNITKAGHRHWTIIDDDVLLPHNCARHALTSCVIGRNKSEAMVPMISDVMDEEMIVTPLPANVLNASEEDRKKLETAFSESTLVCDFSASVAVGKALSDNDLIKRTFGAFITPDSNSLVFLAEDSKRRFRIDWLEMLHYRAVLHADVLRDSFAPNGEKFRYGNSCRDVSMPLPQYKLSIFSGIAAKEILEAFTDSGPRCAVFHLSPETCAVTPVAVEITGVREYKDKTWTFRIDQTVLNAMRRYREERLPRETGGVLVGNFDTYRRICSVVTAMPSPPDSEEWPTC